MKSIGIAVSFLTVFGSHAAQAHIVGSRLGDFYAGALHPLTGLEDVILWTAMGVLAGTQPSNRARWLVLLFPAGLLAGLALGLATGFGAGTTIVDAGLMVALGSLLALAVRLPGPVLHVAALSLAIVRGAANAGGIAPQDNVVLFAAGFTVAGYAVITLTMAMTLAFRLPDQGWRTVTLRAAGSWVAAIGIMIGGFALRAV